MATLQLEAAANAKQQLAAADPSTAAAAPLLLGDDEEANIRHHQADSIDAAGSRFSWVPVFLGFLFLTFNSAMAIVRSHGDAWAVAFVGLTYADLLALFPCLRMYERAPAGSSARSWLKIAVWVLTTLLTLAFSGKVATIMPPPVAVIVWLMAFATVAGGFLAFFVCKDKKEETEEQSWKETTCTGAC